MKLTILGCGPYNPFGARNSSSYMLEHKQTALLLDMGRGAIGELYRQKKTLDDIDAIFITHTHEDHCSELVPLLQCVLTPAALADNLRTKPLTIYGPKGLKKLIKRIKKAFKLTFAPQLQSLVRIQEIPSQQSIALGDFSITPFQTQHSSSRRSFSYRVTTPNKIFAYSGDTMDCAGVRKAVEGADVALVEATLPQASHGHLSGAQAGMIARDCNVKNLLLTHVKWEYFVNKQVIKDAQKNCACPVHLAEDGLKIRV